jgi:hypothetical protein
MGRVCAATLVALTIAAFASFAAAVRPGASTLPPRGFSGTLADREVQSGWSEGPTQFGGFSTVYAFSKLVFGSGKQGPYTLTSGDAVLKSGDVLVRETSPAGADGTCSTTFLFAQTGQHVMLYGDIGSLSRTSGGWRATVSLGVILPGKVSSQDNCGPNGELSEDPFGVPPKISIPINVSGELNAATGVLTVDATSSTPVGGGAGQETDLVTGTLRPTCPDPNDDALLADAADYLASSNTFAQGAAFKAFVIGIRKRGGTIDAQIQQVEESRSTWGPRFQAAAERDRAALKAALASWLAAARCPETRSKLQDEATSKADLLEQNANLNKNDVYALAEKAIRDNCGCGGFGPPEK